MVEATVTYEGDLHTVAVHGPSGSRIATDAPKDNQGKGEAFSPTDLVGAALASCTLTLMGIVAARRGLDMKGARCRVVKEMATAPERRIGSLSMVLDMPPGIPAEFHAALTAAAEGCPVKKSLHPDVSVSLTINW